MPNQLIQTGYQQTTFHAHDGTEDLRTPNSPPASILCKPNHYHPQSSSSRPLPEPA
jgi:hypothetical protein